ncbi:UbiA family prenyltransferase [Taibaiella chishuiensis]|nr:UbiA family prenyltransferase [Taibaiella chishuiensis]
MKFLKWILYTSIFAACCAAGLCMATEKLLLGHIPAFGTALHWFVIANTLCIYNLHYYIKRIPAGVSDRADWTLRHRWVHPALIVLGCLISLVCLFYLPFKVILVSVGLGVLSLGYSVPILPFPQKRRLKDWGLLKLFLLSMVWTAVTVLMPMAYWNKSFEAYEVEFLLRFTFMLPLCIAFDIRDMETDRENSIYTLPNAIGLQRCFRLMDFFLLVLLGLAVWQYTRYPILQRLWSALAIIIVTKIVLVLSRKYRSDIFYLLFIDGMMLVYAAFILWR